ncbi:hypothetical protein PPL_10577 [Heterostelium album PN500]|uniref:Kelch motif family protein n=1 Tax=Heterostelium pallidum (strain ATCC 26659 / Pp 5 / PN500) TaxID=670386 RepID=D3BRG6_HETP5|nr:hypothetical protein PPL_10577 [Heterostelium album PN500]EFA75998.1 hypothetical protein PPL_10577 [Heterostelium album PN500]|eukprot:XP_020428132.1 hypothetical protein PPL_10577 [Heterostelium album PN500]
MQYIACEPLKRNDIIQGSKCVSTCYDGDKTIYLLGGRSDKGNILSLDSYDLDTKEFKKLLDLDQQRHGAFSCYLDGKVYFLGGFTISGHGVFGEFKSILQYDCATNKLEMYINELPLFGKTIGCCFDGIDSIYLLVSNGNFLKITIPTKSTTSLRSPSIPKYPDTRRPLIYVSNENDPSIYFIGSTKYGNHCFSLKTNSWIQLLTETNDVDINANADHCKTQLTSKTSHRDIIV